MSRGHKLTARLFFSPLHRNIRQLKSLFLFFSVGGEGVCQMEILKKEEKISNREEEEQEEKERKKEGCTISQQRQGNRM